MGLGVKLLQRVVRNEAMKKSVPSENLPFHLLTRFHKGSARDIRLVMSH
jgi:hypothetical protein